MKYVAFLDILGFKQMLKAMDQNNATEFISDFSRTAYLEWEKLNPCFLNGYIVSDSFIIYSNNLSEDALNELLHLTDNICKSEFSENSILIRSAIAKGGFDKLEAKELNTLKKGLIVGQAYVDAYLLESTVKVPGIILSEQVYEDVQNISEFSNSIFEDKASERTSYIFRYLSSDYLLREDRLIKFVKLAQKSGWLPYYYNAIYFALKNENNNNKVDQVFENILCIVCSKHPKENWKDIDTFISNSFDKNVINAFQKRLLRFLRQKLF